MKILSIALQSAVDTYAGIRWVYREMTSAKSRQQIPIAYAQLFGATLCLMALPYTINQVIDAISGGDRALAGKWIVGYGVISLIGMLLGVSYDYVREHIWNRNYMSANINTMHKLLRQTIETLMSSESKIGAEHVESIKDRVQNIMYLFLFELSTTVLVMISTTLFLFTGDMVGASIMLVLTLFNFAWFFIWNADMNERMRPVEDGFLSSQSMLVEFVTFATSVKAAGVERKVEHIVRDAIAEPLSKDLHLWAIWWQRLELVRKFVNVIIPFGVIWYGVMIDSWSLGTISAMSAWIVLLTQQYGNIGYMMRHLASNVARLKEARIELEKERPFEYDKGFIYQPKGTTDAV